MARILIIEDNPANLELMSYLLHAGGHDIDTARDGEDGLAQSARQPAPDIIVCDVHLPRLDGYEVARRLKGDATRQHVPLVAVTALAMVGDKDKVLSAGFDGYISKPINPREFASQVQAFLPDGWPPTVRQAAYPPPAATPAPTLSGASVPNGPRILVVDDLLANRELARAVLEPHGYRVTAADSVAAAHQRMAEEDFDLILSDLHMPEDSGLHLLAAVRNNPRWQQLPFVLTSSSLYGTPNRERSRILGANRFLVRPVSPQQILDAVAACLGEPGEQAIN